MHIRMFTGTATRRGVVATAIVTGALVAGATQAEARWQVHNSADVTQIVTPQGQTEDKTCTDKLRGQSGWSTSVPVPDDPDDYAPASDSGAYGPVVYDIWKAPDGLTDGFFSETEPGSGIVEFLPDGGGDPVPAVFVRQYVTPSRAAITPEYLYPDDVTNDPNSSNLYLFSFAEWTALLPGVAAGELLAIKPTGGGSTFAEVPAIDCGVSKLNIHFVQYTPAGSPPNSNQTLNQEIVVILNDTGQVRGLGGWRLRDDDGHAYRFPSTRLQPGQSVTVHTGKGNNRPGHRYWGRTSQVWDNGGDEAVLRTGAGARWDSCAWGGAGPGYVNC